MSDFHDTAGKIGDTGYNAFAKANYAALTAERPPAVTTEYAIMYANGDVLGIYDSEPAASRTLAHERRALDRMGVPEEYWPVLNARDVEVTVGSWKLLSE